uniref:Uncharacterized protein n=2 Tax=Amphora coffeiformis TaxID=265554 RepID=A0A7S3LBV1_9STRA
MFRLTTLSFLLLAFGSTSSANPVEEGASAIGLLAKFRSWVQEHGKKYETQAEELMRWKVWAANHERIEAHNNKEGVTFTLGHNEYSDMTEEEFAAYFKLGQHANVVQKDVTEARVAASERRTMFDDMTPLQLPDYVNWIQLGGVVPVKNQGACGSCWAFSTTGALEGAKFVRTGELVALSEQNLLDCDHKDLGCNGGLMDDAFKFDEKQGGLCSEEDYPYQARQGSECLTNCTDVPGSKVTSFVDVPEGSEMALLSAIAMQPISVAIQANQFVFQFYKKGVITDDSCGSRGSIDHGVLAVGYGTDLETQEPYFLVKNSWGATWGEDGYVKLGRNSKNQWGMWYV